jgi:hypothetical protein
MGVNAIAAHTRHYPSHLRSPYFSPALPSPDGSPRFSHLTQSQGKAGGKEEKKGTKVYVQAGTAELLWDQAKMLCRGMREEGVDVTLREVRRCASFASFPIRFWTRWQDRMLIRCNYNHNVSDYRPDRALGDRLRFRDTFCRFPGISTSGSCSTSPNHSRRPGRTCPSFGTVSIRISRSCSALRVLRL